MTTCRTILERFTDGSGAPGLDRQNRLFPRQSVTLILLAISLSWSFAAMSTSTRRQFLSSAVAAGSGLVLADGSAPAIEPVVRTGKPHIRLSIAAYSYRQFLDLGRKPKPTMNLDDFVELAAGMDLDAIEPTAY